MTAKKLASKTVGNLFDGVKTKKISTNEQKDLSEKKSTKKESIILEDKINEYIKWYTETIVKGRYTDIGEYTVPKEMQAFIEKMAVWYELRYPDYELNHQISGQSQESKNVSDEMFKKNPYIRTLVGEATDIECLDWHDFYNFTAFYNSLNSSEQYLLEKPHIS